MTLDAGLTYSIAKTAASVAAGVPISIPFKVFDSSELDVFYNGDVKAILGAHYTVTLSPGTDYATATLTPTAALVSLLNGVDDVVIRLNMGLSQEYDASALINMPPVFLENQLDRLALYSNQIEERVKRSIKFPFAVGAATDVVLPTGEALRNKLIGTDAAGLLKLYGLDTAGIGGGAGVVFAAQQAAGSAVERLQQAMAAAAAAPGSKVVAEPGRLDTLGATIEVPSYTDFDGANMELTSTVPLDHLVKLADNATSVGIRNLTVDAGHEVAITSMTMTNPVTALAPGHKLVEGDLILLRDVEGTASALNNTCYTATNVDQSTGYFELYTAAASPVAVDGTSYAYTAGTGRIMCEKVRLSAIHGIGPQSVELANIELRNWSGQGIDLASNGISRRAQDITLRALYLHSPGPKCIFPILVRSGTGGLLVRRVNVVAVTIVGTDERYGDNDDYALHNHHVADALTFQGVQGFQIVGGSTRKVGSALVSLSRGTSHGTVSGVTGWDAHESFNTGSNWCMAHVANRTGFAVAADNLDSASKGFTGADLDAIIPDASGNGAWFVITSIVGGVLGKGDTLQQGAASTTIDMAGAAEVMGEQGKSVIQAADDIHWIGCWGYDTNLTPVAALNISGVTIGAAFDGAYKSVVLATAAKHGLTNYQGVRVQGITGTTQLNDRRFNAILNYNFATVTKGNPTVITTVNDHRLTTGQEVAIDSIAGLALAGSINGNDWTVTVTGAKTFTIPFDTSSDGGTYTPNTGKAVRTKTLELYLEDGAGHGAYVSGGTIEPRPSRAVFQCNRALGTLGIHFHGCGGGRPSALASNFASGSRTTNVLTNSNSNVGYGLLFFDDKPSKYDVALAGVIGDIRITGPDAVWLYQTNGSAVPRGGCDISSIGTVTRKTGSLNFTATVGVTGEYFVRFTPDLDDVDYTVNVNFSASGLRGRTHTIADRRRNGFTLGTFVTNEQLSTALSVLWISRSNPCKVLFLDTAHGASPVAISAITQANPGVVTTAAPHGFSNGDRIGFYDVGGMVEVETNSYAITVIDPTNFSIVSTSGFTPYTSGGFCAPVAAHGLDRGDEIRIENATGITSLNGYKLVCEDDTAWRIELHRYNGGGSAAFRDTSGEASPHNAGTGTAQRVVDNGSQAARVAAATRIEVIH